MWTALKLGSSPAEVTATRHRVAALLSGSEVDPEQMDRVLLALSELVTNAVLHGSEAEVTVEVWREPSGGLVLRVSQQADGTRLPDASSWRLPDSPSRIGGRGLAIVAAVADAVDVHADDHATRVSARFSRRSDRQARQA